jgi:hypothetical protein
MFRRSISLPSSALLAKYVIVVPSLVYSSKKARELETCFEEWKKQAKKIKLQAEDL